MTVHKDEPKIRGSYHPSSGETESLSHVYTRKEFMRAARSDYETQWDKNEKQYEAYKKDLDLEDWQSDYFVPLTTSIIESQLAEMVDQNPRPLILPREPSDKSAAKILEAIFDYTWDIGNGDVELYKILKDALTFGTGIAQESYLSLPRVVKEMVRYDAKTGKEVYEKKEIKDFDDVYMEAVKLQEFFVDDTARSIQGPRGARDCVRRQIMHIDDFHAQFKGPILNPLGHAQYVVAGGDTNYYEFFKPPVDLENNQVEVLHYWNKPEDLYTIVANDVLIRETPNPYKHKQLPFVRFVDLMRTHLFYGKGEADLLESINEELNRLRRMRHDRLHLSIDQMFLVNDRENIDEAQLMVRPHGKIEVQGLPVNQSIQPLVYPDIPQSSYLEEDRIKEDAVRVTGQDDRMQSVNVSSTATEAAILKESTLKRIRLKLKLIERDSLTQIGRLRVANIQQFYSLPKVGKIVGEEGTQAAQSQFRTIPLVGRKLVRSGGDVIEVPTKGVSFFTVTPEMIRGQFDVKIVAGSTLPISKPLMQSKVTELVDRLLPLAVKGIGYDPVKVMDKYIEVLELDPDDFKQEEALTGGGQADLTQQSIELAGIENEELMKGNDVGPTPDVDSGHTEIHLAFMRSDKFKNEVGVNDPRLALFVRHVMGEQMAQQSQGQEPAMPAEGSLPVGQMPGQPMNLPRPQAPNMGNSVIPAKIQGGENVPPIAGARGMGPGTMKRSPFKRSK